MLMIVAMALDCAFDAAHAHEIGNGFLAALIAAFLISWPWRFIGAVGARAMAPALLVVIALSRFLPFACCRIAIPGDCDRGISDDPDSWRQFRMVQCVILKYSTQKIMQTAIPGTYNLPSV